MPSLSRRLPPFRSSRSNPKSPQSRTPLSVVSLPLVLNDGQPPPPSLCSSLSLKGELVRALGGAVASTSLLGVPLGHNSSFLQGPAFAPPRIREAIWCGSTNSTTEEVTLQGNEFGFLIQESSA
ncbi:arginase 2, chloroplastic/mitochondrial-like isoform X3 [Malus sylvestris]|uniref:arginase 2, chloroplastic/mitochondrial-like isoform X3 n=1 Tax=Malus sylvestris TaxID=3752 RepID=UPI0021ABA740|nr:arginase 2, chloroplastic/mitochondrial-like isoform X3 [Malus sylvestris]